MNPVALQLGPISIRWYAICIVSGLILAVYLSMKEFASKQKSEQERSVLVNEKLKMNSVSKFFTFNFQLARGQSHCRDCPLAFGDILILKLLIFLECDFNLTVAR